MDILARYRGCLLGLAVGDAVGTTVEFQPRGMFPAVTDMTGGGPFHLQPGEWTDDTSMALCMAHSLVERGGFDARDQMERYVRWRREGYMSSNGRCFDIGTTIGAALDRFELTGDPSAGSSDPNTSGNGGIMRLAPVVLFYHPDRAAALRYAAESSRLTHASPECISSARLLADVIHQALSGTAKDDVARRQGDEYAATPKVHAIAQGDYIRKADDEIRGTGYVVNSLEAALWSFWHTGTFEQAILRAVNLGDDTDTTAAICGQVAGAFYGEDGIPAHWLDQLAMRGEISTLAGALHRG
jgi:ADP-ribosyl-[dinitrogen reductase] hydrolase